MVTQDPHAIPQRGLDGASKSPNFQGRFRRMFRTLPAATYGNNPVAELTTLGNAMTLSPPDHPKDGHDDEESALPALFTYFGQFVDHDITFDPNSSLQKENDPAALLDFRSPALDMDNIYGRGPDDQPYMYDPADRRKFILGDQISGGTFNGQAVGAIDLLRGPKTGRALIGDPRNDENAIVSQLQSLFLRFHNKIADKMIASDSTVDLAAIQREVRYTYQYIVLGDFLPRIIRKNVLDKYRTGPGVTDFSSSKLRFYDLSDGGFMPLEFSVAAYRMGHSMVRPGYRLNDAVGVLPIFDETEEDLRGFRPMIPVWGIDWRRFIDLETLPYDNAAGNSQLRLQLAYKMDTSLVGQLGVLPSIVTAAPPQLAVHNLLRGFRLDLPTGQSVAQAMNVAPILTDDEILIGPSGDNNRKKITDISAAFHNNCPLWTYILAEAALDPDSFAPPVTGGPATITTPQLGEVGGGIVAESFLGMLFADENSILNCHPQWESIVGVETLKDLVTFVLS